ncbi:MAG: rhodanese-like domain-containing protein [Bacteroidales bacterium]
MKKQYKTLTTPDLQQKLADETTTLIDVRPVEAYNGWRLRDEKRGGHIPGARSLPVKWTNYLDWIEIVRSKGIMPEETLVIYGYTPGDAIEVANFFQTAGYDDISLYHHFTEEWSANPDLPLEKLSRYRHLVSAGWVKTLLDGGRPAEYHHDRFVICHAHYQNPEDYKKGHIPGAISLDTNRLESPETWNRRQSEEIRRTLESLGITADTTVVLYGRFSFPKNDDPFPGSSAGHLGSIRCAFIMMYAGVKDVRILNGGVQSWIDAGYELTTEETLPQPVRDFGVEIPQNPHLVVDVPEAKEMLAADDAELVCVRSWPEYIGEVSGYNYIEKKGRIPGAVFGNCGTDAYHMENYRNLDHTTREYHEIEENWKEAGIVPDKHLAFYCGTGWRGSEAWLNAWLMGWPRVSVFDGGWFEWSSDPANPYETGVPAELVLTEK